LSGKSGKTTNRVKEIDVSSVEGNKILAAEVDRRTVERCKDAIERLGVFQPPVVGATQAGGRIVLSGQCELTAARELGADKMDAVEVDVPGGDGGMAKLSLLLISLQKGPGALCEGMLLREAVNNGATRAEITAMLGKSASWLSNRLSLVTRLDANVYEMVRRGMLDPRSAQEVARLPADTQFAFAEKAVCEGLPKSVIEALVAGYNDAGCPGEVRGQILSDPQAALKRMTDKRRAFKTGGARLQNTAPKSTAECINTLRAPMAYLAKMLYNASPFEMSGHMKSLRELENELVALLDIIRRLVSPGKKGVADYAG
jgi:ParB-like chromosome segregation protein Spo0J